MALEKEKLKVFLIGLPGSGKSTLAKQVSEQAGLQFFDLDAEIEKDSGKKVEELFAGNGETYFREMEGSVLKKFCGLNSGFIMATGGGAPCFNANMEIMNAAGVTIFLDVTAKEICSRILKQSQNRPLLKHETPDSLKDRIEFLRSHRISFYRKANHSLTGNEISPEKIIGLLPL